MIGIIMLTEQQIKFYKDNGFLVVENVFEQASIAKAIEAIEETINDTSGERNFEVEPSDMTTVRRIWSPTKKHKFFWELATDDKLLDMLQELIGNNIQFHYSKLNMKGPKVGSVVEWHQDFSYYPHTNSDLVTALLPFDDMNEVNGCLKVIPGSHKKGLTKHYIDGYFRGKITDIDEQKVVNLEVPAGGVIFLHCLTQHSSDQNTSNFPRRTFLPAYRAADAYPIYFGPHAAHNENGTSMVRGIRSSTARLESAVYSLPLAESEFGSIYEVQEGSHLTKAVKDMVESGYAVD
jgi:phytanoyl-CoA hydroxylase